VIIATNNALDKSRDARKSAETLQDISKATEERKAVNE
jgi:hypothetical protein